MPLRPNPSPVLVLVAAAALTLGCGENASGPCVHVYRDPVLLLQEARSTSGTPVGTVLLSDFSRDGEDVEASRLAGVEPAHGVEVASPGRLRCEVPCGFGVQPGTYRFRANAPGYRSVGVRVKARYSDGTSGCPSSSSGGTSLTVVLSPAD